MKEIKRQIKMEKTSDDRLKKNLSKGHSQLKQVKEVGAL